MRLSSRLLSLLAVSVSLAIAADSKFFRRQSNNTDYVLKQGPLDTPWTESVGTDPWPEYPRPLMERSDWLNLNGVWRYWNVGGGPGDREPPPKEQFPNTTNSGAPVLVPFCLESALSGVMGKKTYRSWYRRTFDVPSEWDPKNRVLLNFGAVDYETNVWINGQNVTWHEGGYWAFEVDVTDYLVKNGTNELLVYVWDPTNQDIARPPLGKQVLDPSHIWYTPCSGIWQTVWLESAPAERIIKIDLDANMNGFINVTVHSSGNSSSAYDFVIHHPKDMATTVTVQGTTNEPFIVRLENPELWSPESPTLYNVTVKLGDDTVSTYMGFRTISQGIVDDVQRPLLNGKFVFQFSTLDQGYWPDGLYSPPSVEAMEWDLRLLKDTGFNMVRKHIKVEPPLFYYACDRMGLMVMQDMPSMTNEFYNPNNDPDVPKPQNTITVSAVQDCIRLEQNRTREIIWDVDQAEFDRQLAVMIEQHKSYPSIVAWVIYNEGWGQASDAKGFPEYRLTQMVKSLDPTRLVNSVTGWHDHGVGDYHDNHHYSYPQCGTPWYSIDSTPYDDKRIGFQGEFGGIGLNVSAENAWKVLNSILAVNQTYELTPDKDIWNMRAHKLFVELQEQVEQWSCSGAVYTQTTDVEGEVNGLVSYDRRINRMNVQQWKDDIQGLYDAAAKRSNGTEVYMPMPEIAGLDAVPVLAFGKQ